MDPVTAIVTALSSGAALAFQETTKAVVRDAYDKLKEHLRATYPGVEIEPLEKHPESERRKAFLKEDLERDGAATDTNALQLGESLIKVIKAEVPVERQRAVGIKIGTLEDVKAVFESVISRGNAGGVEIETVKGGELRFGTVRAETDSPGDAYSKKA